MTLTIEITETALALLHAEAARAGRPVESVAAERLTDTLSAQIDPEAVDGIREGLADAQAGRTVSLEDYRAQVAGDRGSQ